MKSPAAGQTVAVLIVLLLVFFVTKQYYDVFRSSPPPVIAQISCLTTSSGDRVTGAEFKNTSGRQLDEVKVAFIFKTENTKDVAIDRYWLSWAPDEIKKFPFPADISIQKISLTGTCTQGRFDSTWLPHVKVSTHAFDPESKLTPYEQGKLESLEAEFTPGWEPKEMIITRQTAKIQRLQETLTGQYKELETRRATLKETGEVDRFNKDAAEYARRVQELRNEEAFLNGLTMKSKGQ